MANIKVTVHTEITAGDGEVTSFRRTTVSAMQDNPLFWEDTVDEKVNQLKKELVDLTRFQFGSIKE